MPPPKSRRKNDCARPTRSGGVRGTSDCGTGPLLPWSPDCSDCSDGVPLRRQCQVWSRAPRLREFRSRESTEGFLQRSTWCLLDFGPQNSQACPQRAGICRRHRECVKRRLVTLSPAFGGTKSLLLESDSSSAKGGFRMTNPSFGFSHKLHALGACLTGKSQWDEERVKNRFIAPRHCARV
jgi:hypothetical protein